jgi:hypothetical protein
LPTKEIGKQYRVAETESLAYTKQKNQPAGRLVPGNKDALTERLDLSLSSIEPGGCHTADWYVATCSVPGGVCTGRTYPFPTRQATEAAEAAEVAGGADHDHSDIDAQSVAEVGPTHMPVSAVMVDH